MNIDNNRIIHSILSGSQERLATICVNAVNANSTLVYEFGQITGKI